ncbi:flagellar M-ring protein FliF [Alsobacter soli]|uniref:Flagellar M-ring protein n=1 Tax=Alsobacter soli TaxID=2109933 RepID=A0A2T1HYW3_9HYPH|nr:flagellar basal-body MS-ring/collar protein FliF [Alsobacter soli]PSC06886.1 flagellar M-ring protein FliF [Alsobacter soli]
MNGLIEFLNKLGPARIAAMGAVTLALVGFFAFVIMRVTQPTMGVLYADLGPEDSSAIVRELDQRGVKYELREDGRAIATPKADIPRLRMDLAGKGMPAGGSVGYEIFDKGDAFSSTSFVQGVNQLRALEGELARTIRSLSRVQSARVHLVIPERKLFMRDREPASASIALKVSGDLDSSQVRAIRHLVASAVEGMKPERISIVDERGRLLADGAQGDNGGPAAVEEKQQNYERRLRTQVEEIVASVVGQGRTRVQVSAEMDLNRVQQTSESFDPESRVVRSTQTRNESQATTEAKDGQVTVGNELPGAKGDNGGQQKDASQKSEEIVNYEISRTTRTETVEGGRVKRLSVAVLVDGVYGKGANGEVTYQPRTQEELDRITALVRSAIGYDNKRGDQLEVVNLRFAEAPPVLDTTPAAGGIMSLLVPTRDDIMRGIELAVLALLVLIVTLVVVRPLVRTILAPLAPQPRLAEAIAGSGAAAGRPGAIAGPAGPGGAPAIPVFEETEAGRMLDIARVQGQVQARSVERIGEIVKENPAGTATILRQWINEEAGS